MLSVLKMSVRRPYVTNIIKDVLRSSIGTANSLGKTKPTRFVIFTNGRTGSNLLVSLLNEHPKLRIHSEIFGEYQLEDHINRSRINRIGAELYFQNAFRPMVAERAVGLKCLYYHFNDRYGKIRGVPELSKVENLIQQDTDLKFIHLKRHDMLGCLISRYLASKSNNWEGGSYSRDPVDLDLKWAREELDRMVSWEQEFDSKLPQERTLTTSYEALVSNAQPVMDDIWSLLSLEPKEVQIRTKKQNTRPHSETIKNFEALRSALSGSKHAELFTN